MRLQELMVKEHVVGENNNEFNPEAFSLRKKGDKYINTTHSNFEEGSQVTLTDAEMRKEHKDYLNSHPGSPIVQREIKKIIAEKRERTPIEKIEDELRMINKELASEDGKEPDWKTLLQRKGFLEDSLRRLQSSQDIAA